MNAETKWPSKPQSMYEAAIYIYTYMYKWFLICRYGNIIISSKHSQFIWCMNMSILPWLMSYMIQDSLSVECIEYIAWAEMECIGWIRVIGYVHHWNLPLVEDGDMCQLDNEWQATSFQGRGGKVGKLTKQFWWNLGVQPETKTLSESIVSVERFDYSGYQCRFNRRHAQYNKHIILIYIYIHLYCVLQQIVLPIIWWFQGSTIYTPGAYCQESIFQDAASKPQKEGGRFVTKGMDLYPTFHHP